MFAVKFSRDQNAADGTVQVTESSVDCRSESVGQQSNSHVMDQSTKTECTSSSKESESRTEKVDTKSAELAEKVDAVDAGEASVDERDSECKAEDEAEMEGEGMELEEKGEDKVASRMETDMQREVEDAGKTDGVFKTSTKTDKVHVYSTMVSTIHVLTFVCMQLY